MKGLRLFLEVGLEHPQYAVGAFCSCALVQAFQAAGHIVKGSDRMRPFPALPRVWARVVVTGDTSNSNCAFYGT